MNHVMRTARHRGLNSGRRSVLPQQRNTQTVSRCAQQHAEAHRQPAGSPPAALSRRMLLLGQAASSFLQKGLSQVRHGPGTHGPPSISSCL